LQEITENCRLTARQEKAILALLSQPTIQAAAKAAKISERTLYLWLKEPAFSAAYREARATAVSQAISRLQQVSGEAVTTLQDVMKDPQAPAPARVTAATKILELALRGIELAELQRRIQELERTQDTPDDLEKEEDSIVSPA
jgi:hypothetical protein